LEEIRRRDNRIALLEQQLKTKRYKVKIARRGARDQHKRIKQLEDELALLRRAASFLEVGDHTALEHIDVMVRSMRELRKDGVDIGVHEVRSSSDPAPVEGADSVPAEDCYAGGCCAVHGSQSSWSAVR